MDEFIKIVNGVKKFNVIFLIGFFVLHTSTHLLSAYGYELSSFQSILFLGDSTLSTMIFVVVYSIYKVIFSGFNGFMSKSMECLFYAVNFIVLNVTCWFLFFLSVGFVIEVTGKY